MTDKEKLNEALETIDDMINRIANAIIEIANGETDNAANALYQIMDEYAREEDTQKIYDKYAYLTGRNIDE